LNVSSDPANLAGVREAFETFCGNCGFDSTERGEIVLCVNEALANVTRHAYGGATDRPIAVSGEYQDGAIEITIRDWGNGVNPAALPPKPHDPLTPGGLGLVCLRRLMDDVQYTPQSDGMVMKMRRNKKSGEVPARAEIT